MPYTMVQSGSPATSNLEVATNDSVVVNDLATPLNPTLHSQRVYSGESAPTEDVAAT
jgi:hypothetical protein